MPSPRPAPAPLASAITGAAANQPDRVDSPAPPILENLRTFDPATAQLLWHHRNWQIVANGEVLKDFGTREVEARQALRLIQSLGLNQYATIGSSGPVLEYWLVNGQAPTASSTVWGHHSRTVHLQPESLHVENVQGQWCVRNARQVLFNFGPSADDARQALSVLHKYHFTQLDVLGQGMPSMLVFATQAATDIPLLPSNQHLVGPGHSTGQSINTPHFSRAKGPPEINQAQATENGNPTKGAPAAQVPLVLPATGIRGAQPAVQQQTGLLRPGEGPANPGNQQPGGWRAPPHFGHETHTAGVAGLSGQGAAQGVQRIPFDWRQVQLRQDNLEWKLQAGSLVLANFGRNDHDARLALSAIRHYRFTEQWRMEGQQSGFNWFTANTQAPLGLMFGLNARALQPDQLAVRQVAGRYALCQNDQVVVPLGERQEQAKALLDAIQRNKFDRLCQLGNAEAGEGVAFLVKSR
jgi:hypothetical protein